MTGTLHLGIDVSMAENTCCFLLQNGTEVRRRHTVSNNLPGAKELVEELLRLMEHHHLDRLMVGLEATNLYLRNHCKIFPSNVGLPILFVL